MIYNEIISKIKTLHKMKPTSPGFNNAINSIKHDVSTIKNKRTVNKLSRKLEIEIDQCFAEYELDYHVLGNNASVTEVLNRIRNGQK